MHTRMPKMQVLEAFMEAARAPNFRTAADRCGLSPAAFSRRIQAFTQFAGRPVFEKGPSGMALTAAGRECLVLLEPTYLAFRQAAASVAAPAGARCAKISLSHSLAVGWLIPRLERFRGKHPEINVDILTERTAAPVRTGSADLGICASDVDTCGLRSEHLLDILITPVACPDTARALSGGDARLAELPRLSMRQHPDSWDWWSNKAGVRLKPDRDSSQFDVTHALYEAAAARFGIALGVNATVAPHLQSGRLVTLGLPTLRYPSAYSLVMPEGRVRNSAALAFADWLRSEAGDDPCGWTAAGSAVAAA